ncbi:hypothetical protein HYG89_15155 [Acinetobacter sp. SwsAc5]|uniref:hypothetical protein n=1 Tax=Acinetobacter sp. SwsAc5 TaxID=2749438 RepID=UPI0015C03F9C|nr:hypothetical protein [Acinetobacter sp. SwsAc5]NWK53850.1 hypothetical protein [Acinetobacter sp. SwsAc5]
MTYLDEVLYIFVDDISTKLNIDLSWILEQRSEKLQSTMSRQYSDELKGVFKTKLDRHNLNLQKKLSDIQDVAINRLEQSIIDFGEKYIPVERLQELKQQGIDISDSLNTAINDIDNVKNIVEFAKGNIPVNEIAQCEAVKNLVQSAAQRYLQNNERLVIPLQAFEKVKAFWEYQVELGNLDVEVVMEELLAGQISRNKALIEGTWVETVIITFSDEEKAKEKLQNLADHFLIAESELYYQGNFVTHEVIKHANLSIKQAIAYMVGRCIVEIRQAWKDKSVDFSTRFKNVIDDTQRKFKEIFEEDFIKKLSKSVIDYVIGLISGFYKNIYKAIQKGGKYFKIICDEMWLFITGKNKSLFQTISNIAKAIAALAVITLIVGLYQYLISIGIPEVFSVVITSFVSALLMVAIFRLIEKVAQITGSVFYTRDVARVRRQEVERICEEVLPLIEEKVALLDGLIEQEDKEREAIFNKSFEQITSSLTSIEIDQIVLAYQKLYQYLGKDLPFKNEKEFDDFMMDGKNFVI